MADKKKWGSTVLGWFVVNDDQGASDGPPAAEAGDVDALIRRYAQGGEGAAAPGAPAPDPSAAATGALPPLGAADIDLAQVYQAFGVDADERDRVSRARDLLRALPAETPAPVKRQIVEASLRSFGVPMDRIIEAAAESLQALELFLRQGAGEAQALLEAGTARIQQLEQEIVAERQRMEEAVAAQRGRAALVNQEKLRVQEVLEFFGQEAVAAVVAASPRLQAPG